MTEFVPFEKIARLSRNCTVTEKIDGTNAVIYISENGEEFLTGSRTRWITPKDDNYGFSKWAHENKEELMKLGPGFHYGEWWGNGIQRRYNITEKRFYLFNTHRWTDDSVRPKCCGVVPVLYEGIFDTGIIEGLVNKMREQGSAVSPGFMDPEGIIVYHHAERTYFKKTCTKDNEYKGNTKQ